MSKQSARNIHKLIESATKEMPVEQLFINDLERTIERDNEGRSRKPSKSYKPSSMTCIRNMYYQITGQEPAKESITSELVGILQTGTDRHDHLQEIISKMKGYGVDCEYVDVEKYIEHKGIKDLKVREKVGHEVKLLHEGLNLSFMCDGILKYKGEYFILEIKTETSFKWQRREGIAEEHIPQGVAYSTAFGINKVMFLYENRDFCGKKAYVLKVTDEMKEDLIVGKIAECDWYVELKEVPPYPNNASAKLCQYCKYKEPCKMAGK